MVTGEHQGSAKLTNISHPTMSATQHSQKTIMQGTKDIGMFSLPQPTLSFNSPSLHDKKLLACRIYLPRQLNEQEVSKRGALLAHPYAPLGGSYDDPVIGIVGAEILKHGWILMTFNFRGAGDSQGRTSWTGTSESIDYASIAGLFIQYLTLLQVDVTPDPAPIKSRSSAAIDLIIGGYSYGSMIASNCPPVPTILAPFGASNLSETAMEISLRAEHLAAQTNEELRVTRHINLRLPNESIARKSFEHTLSIGGDELPSESSNRAKERGPGVREVRQSLDFVSRKLHLRKNSIDFPDLSKVEHERPTLQSRSFDFPINTYYLLVSPLLPPVATLTALPFSFSRESGEHMRNLAISPTLAIYGEKDLFTSSKKLKTWADGLAKLNSKFKAVEVDCAGHFWREPGVAQELVDHISNWISTLQECDPKL